MNYRHAFHAGNFADVVKHLALVSAIGHLKKKDKPFVVIDTHGGRGLYDLQSREAGRTGEAEAGIARLGKLREASGLLGEYLRLVRAFEETRYPGSPLIAAQMLRPQDRLIAVEKHEEEVRELIRVLKPYDRARTIEGDGYERLIALLPPPERRGLVLIDPPYEAEDEFERAAQALTAARRRFATGAYMLWFPIKSAVAADAFCGEIANTGIEKMLRIDVALDTPPKSEREKLAAAGLLVINPPFGLAEEMIEAARVVGPLLHAKIGVERLAG